jgi:hypothetical protein
MSNRIVTGDAVGKALEEEGLLPPNCRLLEIALAPREAFVLRYEVYVRTTDLPKLARAIAAAAKDADDHVS